MTDCCSFFRPSPFTLQRRAARSAWLYLLSGLLRWNIASAVIKFGRCCTPKPEHPHGAKIAVLSCRRRNGQDFRRAYPEHGTASAVGTKLECSHPRRGRRQEGLSVPFRAAGRSHIVGDVTHKTHETSTVGSYLYTHLLGPKKNNTCMCKCSQDEPFKARVVKK